MEKILEYQKIDGELWKLEKQLKTANSKKIMEQSISFVEQSKDELMELDKEAMQSTKDYNDLIQICETNINNVEVLTKQGAQEADPQKIKKILEQCGFVSKNLAIIEKKISNLQQKIDNAMEKFLKTTKQMNQAKNYYSKAKEDYTQLNTKMLPEINEIKSKLTKCEKGIDKALLEKYHKARKDRIYPVFVPLLDKSCGGCRMELSVSSLDKLKANKVIECEQCRRIIYILNE